MSEATAACRACGEELPLTRFRTFTRKNGSIYHYSRCFTCDAHVNGLFHRRRCLTCQAPVERAGDHRYCSRECLLLSVGLPPTFRHGAYSSLQSSTHTLPDYAPDPVLEAEVREVFAALAARLAALKGAQR